jgi:isopentenyldiphosphate isomerase
MRRADTLSPLRERVRVRGRFAVEELFEVVDHEGRTIGIAPRSVVHGNPSLRHRVVHVLVFNSHGELLLQRRSLRKDIAAGKWDTSVGGHVAPGEELPFSAQREMREELGISSDDVEFLYSYVYSDDNESELVHTFRCLHDGPFAVNHDEIEEIRFWSLEAIRAEIDQGAFSGHFRAEMNRYLSKDRVSEEGKDSV